MAKICVLLAAGFEEVEALTVVDVVRRGKIYVDTVSTQIDNVVTGSNGIPVLADEMLEDIHPEEYDMVVLPGGLEGVENLEANPRVRELLQYFYEARKPIAAICAAPRILARFGLVKDVKVTSYPGLEAEFVESRYFEDKVVVDGPFITSRGVGTAIDFALEIVLYLTGDTMLARELAQSIVYY